MSGSLQPGNPDPAVVALPRARAPKGAELVRLRLPDRPGSLAGIAGHFAAHGVDVLRLEVLGRQAGLAMAAACGAVTAAGNGREAHRGLVHAALGLVFAEAGLLCLRQDDGSLRIAASTEPDVPLLVDGSAASLLASALFSGECLTADGRAPWAPPGYRDILPRGAVAAIPGGTPPFLVLVLLRDDPAPFVAAELDRLAALVGVAVGTLQLHEARPHANLRRVPAGFAF
jgi:hypothetical protein